MTELRDLEAALEALLFAAGEPVSEDHLLEVFEERERPQVLEALGALVERYVSRQDSGLMIEQVAGGYRMATRPELGAYLRRFFAASGRHKLTMAAMEALAIVAYRQPVTGPEIQELRGVDPASVLRTLLERRLIRIAGRKEVVGRPFLYATTREFLLHFGLRSLQDLPPLEAFEQAMAGEDDSFLLEFGSPDEAAGGEDGAAAIDEQAQPELEAADE
jgi:segregation and condensation protein B